MAKKDMASAAPLALLCFGMTTALAMMALILALNNDDPNILTDAQLKPLKWAMGGTIQLVSGFVELYREDLFHGTVFASYGCFWIAASQGAGCQAYFHAWGVLSTAFTIVALRHSYAGAVLLAGVAITLFLLGAGSSDPANPHVLKAGGWVGFWMGVLAGYCAFAPIIKETYNIILPGTQHIYWPCDKKTTAQTNITPYTGSMYVAPKNRAGVGGWSWPWESKAEKDLPPAPSNTPLNYRQEPNSLALTVSSENVTEGFA